MSNVIDADKMNKIIYYAKLADGCYNESLRQKRLSEEALHKACKLILNNVPFEYTDKELSVEYKKFLIETKKEG